MCGLARFADARAACARVLSCIALHRQRILDEADIRAAFEGAGAAGALPGGVPAIASCGTGVTACVLALALFRLGRTDVAVYDGSWSEWGAREDTAVATGSSD